MYIINTGITRLQSFYHQNDSGIYVVNVNREQHSGPVLTVITT